MTVSGAAAAQPGPPSAAPAAGSALDRTAAAGDDLAAAAAAAPPASTLERALPNTFCADLWRSIGGADGIYSAILAHPFLTGLADGSLPEAAFRHYVLQDVLYLQEYGRALALVAARAPRPAWSTFFCRCAVEAGEVEGALHAQFLAHWGESVGASAAAAHPSPACLLYTSWVLACVHERAFYEGLAAVLPCFAVYLEVGKALKAQGSPHPLYQVWIDKYGGAEFEHIVLQVARMVNEVAAELGDAQRERMRALFQQGCRLEYMFWDGAFNQQAWPV